MSKMSRIASRALRDTHGDSMAYEITPIGSVHTIRPRVSVTDISFTKDDRRYIAVVRAWGVEGKALATDALSWPLGRSAGLPFVYVRRSMSATVLHLPKLTFDTPACQIILEVRRWSPSAPAVSEIFGALAYDSSSSGDCGEATIWQFVDPVGGEHR